MLISHPNKSLFEHLANTRKIGLRIFDMKKLDFEKFQPQRIRKICDLVLALHDIGKSASYFQEYQDISEHLVETWESEIVTSTFVQFMHSIFTNRNKQLKKFQNIANSIIILDEVQAIPFKYWHSCSLRVAIFL